MSSIELFTFNSNSNGTNEIIVPFDVPILKKIDINNLEFVKTFDPILKEKMPEFDFANPLVDPIEFAKSLVKKMVDSNGLGLAANQVGVRTRCFAMAGTPNIVCYNPILIGHGEEEDSLEEGCLSYPNLFIKVKRKKSIKVRYTQPNGETVTHTYAGLTARVFLHEFDHINGRIFYETASLLEKTKAFKNREILNRRKK